MLGHKQGEFPSFRPILLKKTHKDKPNAKRPPQESTEGAAQKQPRQSRLRLSKNLSNLLQTFSDSMRGSTLKQFQITKRKESLAGGRGRGRGRSLNELILNFRDYELIREGNPPMRVQNKELLESKQNRKLEKRYSSNLLGRTAHKLGFHRSSLCQKRQSSEGRGEELRGWEGGPSLSNQSFYDIF